MRLCKKILTLIVVTLSLLGCKEQMVSSEQPAPAQYGQIGDRVAERFKYNVVQITTKFSSNDDMRDGFGFVVGERSNKLYVITANHVIHSDDPNIKTKAVQVRFYKDQGGKPSLAELLNVAHDRLDIALFRVQKPKWYKWEKIDFCPRYKRGENVWFVGQNRKWIVPVDDEAGTLKHHEADLDGYINFAITSVQPGTSGAPLFTKNGIIGMIIRDVFSEAQAVYIDLIRKLVTMHNYPWNSQESPTEIDAYSSMQLAIKALKENLSDMKLSHHDTFIKANDEILKAERQLKAKNFQSMRNSLSAYRDILKSDKDHSKKAAEVEERYDEALEHFETVKSLRVEEKHPYEFEKAKENLIQAKHYLEKKKLEKALSAADAGLAASKNILKRYYLDEVARKAEDLSRIIKEKVREDFEYIPLEVKEDEDILLEEINEILDFAEDLEKGEQMTSLEKVIESIDVCLNIQDSTQSYRSEKLESDVSFEIGEYRLSDRGIQILEEAFLRRIISDKNRYKRQSPDRMLTIKIKVVGYTDATAIAEEDPLLRELIKGVEDEVPQTQPERRQFLNRRFSEFRAKTVGDYIMKFILKSEGGKNSNIKVELEIIGRGEDIPQGVIPSDSTNDLQRRICKIYSHFTVHK